MNLRKTVMHIQTKGTVGAGIMSAVIAAALGLFPLGCTKKSSDASSVTDTAADQGSVFGSGSPSGSQVIGAARSAPGSNANANAFGSGANAVSGADALAHGPNGEAPTTSALPQSGTSSHPFGLTGLGAHKDSLSAHDRSSARHHRRHGRARHPRRWARHHHRHGQHARRHSRQHRPFHHRHVHHHGRSHHHHAHPHSRA